MDASEVIYHAGDALFLEGDASQSLFLIKTGSVEIRKKKEQGYITIAKIYPNEVIGELAFFDRAPRSASAVAINEVLAMEISYDSLNVSYKKVPDYFKTIIRAVVERLRKSNNMIRTLQKDVTRAPVLSEFDAQGMLAQLEKEKKENK